MATVDFKQISDPKERKKLAPYREPHWMKVGRQVIKGASLGFKKSPNGGTESWHVRLFLDGEYHRKNLGPVQEGFDYQEAFDEAVEWCKERKKAPKAEGKQHTIQEVIDAYLDSVEGRGTPYLLRKRDEIEKRLDACVTNAIRKKRANEFTGKDLTTLQKEYAKRKDHRTGNTIKAASVNRILGAFIAALNFGYRQRMIDSNEAWSRYTRLVDHVEAEEVESAQWRYIPKADREAFTEACPEDVQAVVKALQYTGARPAELYRALVKHVVLDDPDPNVEDGLILIKYKGKKTEARRFPLPQGSEVRAFFEGLIKGKEADDHLFTTAQGKPWRADNFSAQHKKVRKAGSFGEAFASVYNWRHTRITDWTQWAGEIESEENGETVRKVIMIPPPEVADITGTSLEFIQKNYYKSDAAIRSKMVTL